MSTIWEKPESETEYTSSETDRDDYISSASESDNPDTHEGGTDEVASLEDSWTTKGDDEQPQPNLDLFSKQELLRRSQLRKHVKRLESAVQKKENLVANLRKKSFRCQEQQSLLDGEKAFLEEAIAGTDQTCLGMFHGRLSKILLDMEAERELEKELRSSLLKAEGELLEAQTAVGHFDQCKDELELAEMAWKEIKDKKFSHRLQAENNLMANAKQKEMKRERELNELKEQQTAASSVIEQWKKASKEEKAFLQAALNQHKATKAKEAEERHKLHLGKRMKAILDLKGNISSSEGTIQAKLLLKQEQDRKQQLELEEERKRVLEDSGIPEEYFLRKKRLRQFQDMLGQFKKKQEERKFDIVEKLIKEEKLNKRLKKKVSQQQSQPSKATTRKKRVSYRDSLAAPTASTALSTALETDTDISTEAARTDPNTNTDTTTEDTGNEEGVGTDNGGHPDTGQPPSETTSDTDQLIDLAIVPGKKATSVIEPEIKGLWDTQNKRAGSLCAGESGDGEKKEGEGPEEGRGGGRAVKREPSKAEGQMMRRAMDKLKKSKIAKQIAAGKEFKGQPFCSKPPVIVFRNFDVGKTYTKKVRLTNVSYTVNRCQLEQVSQNITDFVTVNFDPPGSMSAGMSCSMEVTFLPQLDKDLEGKIEFMSQSGAFAVPVKCLRKKCLVSVDKTELDFGRVHVGETLRQRVTLLNAGALGTRYTVTTVLDTPSTILKPPGAPPTSQSELVKFDLNTRLGFDKEQEGSVVRRSNYSIISNVETLLRPDSTTGLGITTNQRLKSKSTGQITFSHHSEEEEVKDQPKEKEVALSQPGVIKKPQSREKKSRSRPGSTPKKSRPGSRDKSRPRSKEKKKDAPSESVGEETTQPESQDKDESQDMAVDPAPGSQDTAQAENQDTLTEAKKVAEEGVTGGGSVSEQGRDSKACLAQEPIPRAIQLGVASAGVVPAFGSQRIELVFTPHSVTSHVAKFRIICSESTAAPLEVTAHGYGIDQPVYVEQQKMDLRICMLDRLYQSSVVLHNRAATALQVTFMVPSDLQPYLEVLPKHGVVQGEASFAAQLKFTPSKALLGPPTQDTYYTQDDDMWRMPIKVGVANQSRPVPFLVLAHVTPSELTFNPKTLDFGRCNTHESVMASLTITNTSILPQKFGFIDIPSCVDVQPNDGFGSLLPNEVVQIDVIFSAKKPLNYEFDLVCKSSVDKTYRIACVGRGILSPLELSHNSVHFIPTPIGMTSTTTISVTNTKLSRLNSAVIRGTAPPQGTKAFQFSPPPGSPISFSPQVGMVPVGESVEVEVQFCPYLTEESIQEEALQLAIRRTVDADKARQEEEYLAKGEGRRRNGKRRKSLAAPPPVPSSLVNSMASLAPSLVSSQSDHSDLRMCQPEPGSEVWVEAYCSLLRYYSDECTEFDIPCFVSDTLPTDEHSTPTYQSEHTLYLHVAAPTIRPSLILMEGLASTIDFGSVGTGDFVTKKIQIQNIASLPLKLGSSLLDPGGPFQLRNALRDLQPDESHDLLLRFSPHATGKVYDSLTLYGETTPLLELRMVGFGIHPQVDVSLGSGDDLELDMGHAMAKDVVSKTFTLLNSSELLVRFCLSLDSQQPKRTPAKSFRACNYNGQPPFVCVPKEGVVEGEGSKEVRVFFSPDHQSKAYSDKLIVQLNEKHKCNVLLIGQAWINNMYVNVLNDAETYKDEHSLIGEKDSMIPTLPEVEDPPKPLLIMFLHSSEGRPDSAKQPTRREMEIGCVKSNQVKKTSGEFTIDTMAVSNPFSKCFTFDVLKGSVEAGSAKHVTITFTPPKDMACSLVVSNATLTLKGSTTQVFHLLLRTLISER